MDNKVIIAIAAVAIIVIAAVAVFAMNGSGSGDAPSDAVRYDGNGGKLENGNTYYDAKSTEVMPSLFTKSGYHSCCWNTKADGSGKKYMDGDTVSLGTKLYAQWTDTNRLGTVNMYPNIFNLYVAEKASGSRTNIDDSSTELPANDATLIVVVKDSASTVSLDEQNRIIIQSEELGKILLTLSIPVQGLDLGSAKISGNTVSYEINQSVKNDEATLGISIIQII